MSRRAARPETQRLVPSAAALRPSSVVANFQVTNGRPWSTAKVHSRLRARASCSQSPPVGLDAGLGQGRRRRRGRPGCCRAGRTRRGVRRRAPGPASRAGAAGVVAGLERHHGGGAAGPVAGCRQCVDLGVRRAGAPVVALRDGRAVVVEEHAADARVGAERDAGGRGKGQGATHRRLLVLAERHLARTCLLGPVTDSAGAWSGLTTGDLDGRPHRPAACAFHPDFDRRSRSSTWSTGHWW